MILEKLEKILEDLCSLKEDSIKAESGNASAGRRVRKGLMQAIGQSKELRAIILQHTKKD